MRGFCQFQPITLVSTNIQPLWQFYIYALTYKIPFLKVPEINSESVEVVTQAKESVVSDDATKTQENFVSKMFSLMNENPNYKMLGALGMMLVNFSICLTIANWLKHSNLVS